MAVAISRLMHNLNAAYNRTCGNFIIPGGLYSMDIRALLVATLLSLLAGCGSSTNTPVPAPPPIAAKPDVTITFDGERHTCLVALASETQGSAVSCSEVVPFVRDELRLPSGAVYDIRTISGVNEAEMAGVGTNLKAAGYRFIGGH
jgi:hypothetical protein